MSRDEVEALDSARMKVVMMSEDLGSMSLADEFVKEQKKHGAKFRMWIYKNRHNGFLAGYVVVRKLRLGDEELGEEFIRSVYGGTLLS
jgi:hypothetical protein